MVTNKKKWFTIAVIPLFFAVATNFAGCGLFGGNALNKIEIIEQPSLKLRSLVLISSRTHAVIPQSVAKR